MTIPFGGAALYVLSLDMIESIAPWTFFMVDLDLMLEDWEYSSLRYAITSEICLVAGTYTEINSVPRPLMPMISCMAFLKSYLAFISESDMVCTLWVHPTL